MIKNLETEFYIFHEALQNIDKLLIRFKKEQFEEKLVLEILLEVLIEKIYVAYDDKDREVIGDIWQKVMRRFLLKEGINFGQDSPNKAFLN